MKVLFLVTNFARWEGDPHSPWLVDMAMRLRERGVAPSVWAPAYRGQGNHIIHQIPVYRFRYAPSPWERLTHNEGAPNKISNPLYLSLVPLYLAGGLLNIQQHVKTHKYDVLHVHWPLPTALFGIAAHRRNGGRLIASFHGAELLLARRFPGLQVVLRRMTNRCDALTANSMFTARLVYEMTGRKATVIPYGSTIEVHDPESPTASRRDAPRVLFVGRLIERKGLPYLIEAMAHLRQHIPATLEIVGTGGQQARLTNLAADHGVANAVHFLGRVSQSELAQLYATCDVFVLPSIVDSRGDTEGLGVVLLEAMSYARPVIATAVGGISDIVQNEQSGLLVPEKDALALASALKRLLSNRTFAEQLGEAGKEFVKTHFSWPAIVDQVMALYQAT